jgi:HprK-related kinase B
MSGGPASAQAGLDEHPQEKKAMTVTIASLASDLLTRHAPCRELWLDVGGFAVHVRTNRAALREELARYFADLVVPPTPREDICIAALDAETPRFPLEFRDWPREPGKVGKKERYADTPDGRVVFKARTGMQFLLSRDELVAVGPCLENPNQVINFIISQYLGKRLDEGWALCHAAGVALGGQGVGIAARAGAGKSTLALHLMSAGLCFVSNDRLLIRRSGTLSELAGVPKMPRVNPGTLLNNPDLSGLLAPERRAELERMEPGELWQLEEKHDVMVRDVYGPGRCLYRAPLRALIVLNWRRDANAPARFERVELGERTDLLELVMKSPGVFHRDGEGRSAAETARPDAAPYLRALVGVPVYEATGRAQFDVGVGFCRQLLEH